MDIGTAIKEIRIKSLLSQNDFASEIGVSFSTVNRWEKGHATPNYKALKKLREFCHTNHIDFDVDRLISENK
jgi:DNA-binding transcriptional regulator YiaG